MKNRYPGRIIGEKSHLMATANAAKKNLEATLAEAERMLSRDPDYAQMRINSAQTVIHNLEQELEELRKHFTMFDEARVSHTQHLKDAESSIELINSYTEKLLQDGYRLSPDAELQSARMEFKKAQEGLKENEDVVDHLQVVEDADKAKRLALSVQNDWQAQVRMRGENGKAIEAFQAWYEKTFPVSTKQYKETLGKLQEIAPKEIWEPVARDADARIRVFTERKDGLLSEAIRLNNMETQSFSEAAERLRHLNILQKETEGACSSPAVVQNKVLQAHKEAQELLSRASSKIEDARRATRDTDSEGVGKNKLSEAESKFQDAKKLAGSSLPNWIALTALLGGVIVLAESAKKSAKSRADEIESSRRRRRQSDDYHRSSSWSSSSSSHSSGSSGFGGGGFGGGGASGRW